MTVDHGHDDPPDDDLADDDLADDDLADEGLAAEEIDHAELAAMLDDVIAAQGVDDVAYVGDDTAPFRWPDDDPSPIPATPAPQSMRPLDLGWDGPERDDTDPGALRPKAPEPVFMGRTTSRSRAHRAASRLRAIIGLALVVVLSGFVLAAAIGAAVLLITLVLSKTFGSG